MQMRPALEHLQDCNRYADLRFLLHLACSRFTATESMEARVGSTSALLRDIHILLPFLFQGIKAAEIHCDVVSDEALMSR
jgi:hypothetical protein